jgi:hypothetical protein
MKRTFLLFIVIIGLAAPRLGAHRLDEYLQATRVSLQRQRVNLEIDLTPGVSVARQVTTWIDTDGNGNISTSESAAYGRRLLASVALTIDGRAVSLDLDGVDAATVADMAAGIGTLRVRASGVVRSGGVGRHELVVINSHHPEASVYLANALVPADPGIQILDQRRTVDQHSFTILYEAGLPVLWTRVCWGLSALGLIFVTAATRRGLGHSRRSSSRPN